MNEAQVIVTGNLAGKPSLGTTSAGVPVANMRLGYTPRRLDRESGQWVDGQTSWVTVKCWRKLADHAAMCLNKGDPVVVKGVLQVRQFTDKDGNPRQVVEVLASAVGHDLNRGVTHFIRTGRTSGTAPLGPQGDAAAAAGGQQGSTAGDGDSNENPDGLRSLPGLGWDAARDGAAEEDGDMFDETAIAAAALHAVPDIAEENDIDQQPGNPAGDRSTSRLDGRPGPDGDRTSDSGPGKERTTAPAGPEREPATPDAGSEVEPAVAAPLPEKPPETGATVPAGREPGRVPPPRKPGTRLPRQASGTTKEPSLT